jgi:NADH:ubiquinone oxidoreductase subunit 4 (subunit M)
VITKFTRSVMTIAVVAVIGSSSAFAQNTAPKAMPYSTVDHPEFVSASQTTFLSRSDILIGISNGDIAKAYPAAILAQHGCVQDQMADGPIAVTW